MRQTRRTRKGQYNLLVGDWNFDTLLDLHRHLHPALDNLIDVYGLVDILDLLHRNLEHGTRASNCVQLAITIKGGI